ncbi:DUF6156 family protein [Paramagnetospirillum magneticum]|uniref:DUF6156 family protein n=1 Tax=Paramagnetospirillum magneticum TaxID=84159 RepID=UPI0002F79AA5|nr:DUF6156 family protein [Paramagnetospirillum magneticum]
MSVPDHASCRYFVSYSGVKLPLRLVNPLEESDLGHRNTYMKAWFDAADRLVGCDKLVYGDVQISHRYQYHDNGALRRAEIFMDEDLTVMEFDETGARTSA